MPRVLLTRPRIDSEKLAEKLAAHGFESVIEPLLTLYAVEESPPNFTQIQAVMITSAHALNFLDTTLAARLLDMPCYCVGAGTARAALSFGFSKVFDTTGDGLALAAMIADVRKPDNGEILHIAGKDIDSGGRESLAKTGFNVTVWTVYGADMVKKLSPDTQKSLREKRIDFVLLFSTRTATALEKLLLGGKLDAFCKNVTAIGISDKVIAAVGGLPWRQRLIAKAPTENAILQCLLDNKPEVL